MAVLQRIGDIVRAARERQSCSLADLAERCRVDLPVLAALEQGQPGISTTQLDDVAEALSLDPTALLTGREVARPVPSVFLRHARIQDFDDRDGEILDHALEQDRRLTSLGLLLGEPPFALAAGVFTQREATADRPEAPAQDGYRLAREVRQWLKAFARCRHCNEAWGDHAGGKCLLEPTRYEPQEAEPLGDLRALIETRFGVTILVRVLESNRVMAASVRAANTAAIVLNARDPQRAQNPLLARVHLAHELCHVLFDPSPGGVHIVVDAVVDRKSQAAEQRARAFAAELLLPEEGLVRRLGPARAVRDPSVALELVAQARSGFGTPHEIAANHLCNLGFINRGLRERLEAERTMFAGAVPETTLPAPGAASRLLTEYVARAHREGLVTDGEARALLNIDRLAPLPWDEIAL